MKAILIDIQADWSELKYNVMNELLNFHDLSVFKNEINSYINKSRFSLDYSKIIKNASENINTIVINNINYEIKPLDFKKTMNEIFLNDSSKFIKMGLLLSPTFHQKILVLKNIEEIVNELE